MPRRFTPAQATRTLPLVRPIVAEILEKGREMRSIAESSPSPGQRERVGALEAAMHDLFLELERIGCAYKDFGFDKGLVDFPGEIEGRPVLLCWRSDEPDVRWYHFADSGYAGRTPIPAELLG